VPPILIEVTQLDQVRAAVEQWMVAAYRTEEVVELLSPVTPTHWNSRLFTVALDPSLMIGFWESENPLAGKPIAVEGDLSRRACGLRLWSRAGTRSSRSPAAGALDALLRSGAAKANIQVVRVPGAWEIPAAARNTGGG